MWQNDSTDLVVDDIHLDYSLDPAPFTITPSGLAGDLSFTNLYG